MSRYKVDELRELRNQPQLPIKKLQWLIVIKLSD